MISRPKDHRFRLILLLPAVVILAGCHHAEPGQNNYNPGQCILDGECTAGESCLSCPADCCEQCDLETITQTSPRDYLISEIRWPENAAEAHEFGLDLDGDGRADNKVGYVVALLAERGALINEFIERRVASGELLLVLRVWADDLLNDGEVAVQLLPATVVDATPQFDGQDEVRIAAGTPVDRYACGTVQAGLLESDPTVESQPLPSPMGRVTNDWMRFHRLRLAGYLGEEQLVDVVVAGGIDEYDRQNVLFADILALLNEELRTNDDNSTVELLADLFDGRCFSTIPGCELVVAGEGQCDDTAEPVTITSTELQCNDMMHAIASPDLDSDGDGVNDLLSGAWRVSAVPVTIVD